MEEAYRKQAETANCTPIPSLRWIELAEALVEFDEVHMKRPRGIPTLKPPEDVSIEHLRLYTELRRTAERIVAYLGRVPTPERSSYDLSLDEIRSLPEQVDAAIRQLLEVQRELDLAASAKRMLKDLSKRRAELESRVAEIEEMIRQYYEAAAAVARGRAARIIYLVEAGLTPSSSTSSTSSLPGSPSA